jgi:DNA-binding CsgD family transcriptional regulator
MVLTGYRRQRQSEEIAVNYQKPLPQRSRGRGRLEQHIADLALDVSYAIARREDYGEHLVSQAHLLFGADAGVGLTTWTPGRPITEDQLSVVVAGAPPLPEEHKLHARSLAGIHPGFLAMARVGTADAVRISDHTEMAQFWTTETYWWMHGHSNGRYPASAMLVDAHEVQIFLGMHRQDQDFTDADLAGLAILQRPLAAACAFRAALDDTVGLLRGSSRMAARRQRGGVPPRSGLDAAVHLCRDYAPTRREAEVLTLAAEGWTNHQIGRRLGITERTVRKHLGAVYDKAGVRGRAAATAWWQRRND